MKKVRLTLRKIKIIWFLDNSYMVFVTFILSILVNTALRRIKDGNKKLKMPNSKGRALIQDLS